jgi:predicted NUDIX family phosphoesterase
LSELIATSEQVLVVPTARLDALGRFVGFSADRRYFDALDSARFVPRGPAESDESLRQIIPYVVIEVDAGAFSYARTRAGGEVRLHDRRSVGVGGHVNPPDLPGGLAGLRARPVEALAEAARRELAEETVGLDGASLRWLGFIREDGGVSAVHFGVVFLARPTAGSVRLSDEGKMADAGFAPWRALAAELARYESWSAHVIRHLAG